MNKYLFRGKRIDDGEWAYGDLLTDGVDFECAIRVHGANENNSSDIVVVVPGTVGQYIGITDINGKKIFEGDAIRFIDVACSEAGYYEFTSEGVVRYDTDTASFYVARQSVSMDWVFDDCEVIGNIYDDPRLLDE